MKVSRPAQRSCKKKRKEKNVRTLIQFELNIFVFGLAWHSIKMLCKWQATFFSIFLSLSLLHFSKDGVILVRIYFRWRATVVVVDSPGMYIRTTSHQIVFFFARWCLSLSAMSCLSCWNLCWSDVSLCCIGRFFSSDISSLSIDQNEDVEPCLVLDSRWSRSSCVG